MSELIDREAFINSIVCTVSSPCETRREQADAQNKQKYTVSEFIKELRRAPTIDAVIHGEWIEEDGIQTCSECGEEHEWEDFRASYCDNCGAKMDKRRESEGM